MDNAVCENIINNGCNPDYEVIEPISLLENHLQANEVYPMLSRCKECGKGYHVSRLKAGFFRMDTNWYDAFTGAMPMDWYVYPVLRNILRQPGYSWYELGQRTGNNDN